MIATFLVAIYLLGVAFWLGAAWCDKTLNLKGLALIMAWPIALPLFELLVWRGRL